ncbi:uncharacterized protein [Epargyreus clarus]|uniref:uncharacterized protein n=1 Tax=Epargyreus clarus TaxID=520877 RepID=UPI003C2B9346
MRLLMLFLNFVALLNIFVQVKAKSTMLTKYEKKGDKLILKPVELIDLILEERLRKEIPSVEQYHEAGGKLTNSILPIEEATETVFTTSNIEHGVDSRKMWSRWSKWGECSATCGAGSTVRRRLCVAGRCARGEREEQRRPCVRPPCAATDNIEQRDLD